MREVRAGGEEEDAGVGRVADVGVGARGDELVVVLDDDLEGEEVPEDVVGPQPDGRAAEEEGEAGEEGGGERGELGVGGSGGAKEWGEWEGADTWVDEEERVEEAGDHD